ncbi:hypothetical protein [Aminobacter sp. DSM 101952]|uniref:hypothetical protein n=1 Tax=Aminobacter sp. DSM 101952 TaxID=2735891 RepID=UPI0012E3F99D|nr:hypothetical protein [Aminobacter sp. DSM 101952]
MLSQSFSEFEAIAIGEKNLKIEPYTSIEILESIWEKFDIPVPRVALFPQASAKFGNLRKIFKVVESGEVDAIVLTDERPSAKFGNLRKIFKVVESGEVDAIVLTDERHLPALEDFRSARNLGLVPVINVTGGYSHVPDVDFDIADPNALMRTAATIRKFSERRARLSPKFLLVETPAARMVAGKREVWQSPQDLQGR